MVSCVTRHTGDRHTSTHLFHRLHCSSAPFPVCMQDRLLRLSSRVSGYITSTVIGPSACPQCIRPNPRLCHFIMPHCVGLLASQSNWSLPIHGTSIAKDGSHTTPLHAASVKGHLEVASLLLENGADLCVLLPASHLSLPPCCPMGDPEH
jgi:hypothetical protein